MIKILIPLDGSEPALEAVRFAIRLAQGGLHTSVVLANVQEPTHIYEMVMAPDPEVLAHVSTTAGATVLEAGAALLEAAGMVFEQEVATGDPAHTIIDIVERFECDTIMMGSRGTDRGWARKEAWKIYRHYLAQIARLLANPEHG